MDASKLDKKAAQKLLFELFPEEKENFERSKNETSFKKIVPYILALFDRFGELLEPYFSQLFKDNEQIHSELDESKDDIDVLKANLRAVGNRLNKAEKNIDDTTLYDQRIKDVSRETGKAIEHSKEELMRQFRSEIGIARDTIKDAQNTLDELSSFISKIKNRFGHDLNKEDHGEFEKKLSDLIKSQVEALRLQVMGSLDGVGRGGAQRIQILNNGVAMSKRFIDLNLIPSGSFTISTTDNLTTGRVDVTLNASSGGVTKLSATETPNSVITVFTFAAATSQPSFIVSDGVWYEAILEDGSTAWTWNNATKKATLSIPAPTKSIFAIV